MNPRRLAVSCGSAIARSPAIPASLAAALLWCGRRRRPLPSAWRRRFLPSRTSFGRYRADAVSVISILPHGASPHTFEPGHPAGCGIGCVVAGLFAPYALDLPSGAAIAVVAGLLFLAVWAYRSRRPAASLRSG